MQSMAIKRKKKTTGAQLIFTIWIEVLYVVRKQQNRKLFGNYPTDTRKKAREIILIVATRAEVKARNMLIV